jgi:hypothetical protein
MINKSGKFSLEYEEAIADGDTGEAIYIHPVNAKRDGVTCTIITSGNSGRFEFTTSPKAKIIANTATWHNWASGDVTTTTVDSITAPVTAIRGVSVSGSINIEVVI